MFLFRPAIVRPSSVYELPRPVTSVRIQDSFDYSKLKAPRVNGDMIVGHTASGVDIAIEGQFGSQAGTPQLTEEQMFLSLESFREAVRSATPEERYRLFLYFDPGTSTYRSFQECVTVRFEYDLSKPRLFTYSLVVHASSPSLEQTGP